MVRPKINKLTDYLFYVFALSFLVLPVVAFYNVQQKAPGVFEQTPAQPLGLYMQAGNETIAPNEETNVAVKVNTASDTEFNSLVASIEIPSNLSANNVSYNSKFDDARNKVATLANGVVVIAVSYPEGETKTLSSGDTIGTFKVKSGTEGSYSLEFKESDITDTEDSSLVGSKDNLEITVQSGGGGKLPVNAPPTVELLEPSGNVTINNNETLSLRAKALDGDGRINKVEFLVNGDSVFDGQLTYRNDLKSTDSVSRSIDALLNNNEEASSNLIDVLISEQIDFPTPALGCPEDGANYAQVVTPGHRVLLNYDNKTYDYRVQDNGGSTKLCKTVNGVMGGEYVATDETSEVGNYEFSARAYDNQNATGTSDSVQVEVVSSSPSPEISYILEPSEQTITMPVSTQNTGYGVNVYLRNEETNDLITDQSNVTYRWSTSNGNVVQVQDSSVCVQGIQEPCPNLHADLTGLQAGNSNINVEAVIDSSVVASTNMSVTVDESISYDSVQGLSLDIKMEGKSGSNSSNAVEAGYEYPVAFVGVWRPETEEFLTSSVVSLTLQDSGTTTAVKENGDDYDMKVRQAVLENSSLFSGNGSGYGMRAGDVLVVKPESYLAKTYSLSDVSIGNTGSGYMLVVNDGLGANTTPYFAGDSIVDRGTFDDIDIRDYAFFKSYYGKGEEVDPYFLDYDGDGVVKIHDFVVYRRNLGRMGDLQNYPTSLRDQLLDTFKQELYKVIPR